MSLRLRLTLWYVALLAIILVAFGGGLYVITRYLLDEQVNSDLESRAREVQTAALTAALTAQDPISGLRQRGIVIPPANVFASGDVYFQLAEFDGSVIGRSSNLGDQRIVISQNVVDRVNRGETVSYEFTSGGTRLRTLVAPLVVRGRPVAIIEVAESMRQADLTLAQLATLILGVIVLGLLLTALGGALLARNALRPIDRVTQTARAITRANDLSRRLEPSKSQDEMGRLVSTFNEMLARIEELFHAQQQFVADVSHELRSPLTVMRGNLDLLRRGASGDPVEKAEAWEAVEAETGRMSRLVADLLLLAQADAGLAVDRERVELDTLLLDVYRQARIVSRGVRVVLGHEDQAIVNGDPDRLERLFLNLVENAVKYTSPGGEVKISLQKEGGWVNVSIADTGVGIALEDLPHVFDRFYRADKARSRAAGGTGLGLAIALEIVKTHGGRITVDSELGKGSVFKVSLPLARGSDGIDEPAELVRVAESLSQAAGTERVASQ